MNTTAEFKLTFSKVAQYMNYKTIFASHHRNLKSIVLRIYSNQLLQINWRNYVLPYKRTFIQEDL